MQFFERIEQNFEIGICRYFVAHLPIETAAQQGEDTAYSPYS
jgi:hypothetical protein